MFGFLICTSEYGSSLHANGLMFEYWPPALQLICRPDSIQANMSSDSIQFQLIHFFVNVLMFSGVTTDLFPTVLS